MQIVVPCKQDLALTNAKKFLEVEAKQNISKSPRSTSQNTRQPNQGVVRQNVRAAAPAAVIAAAPGAVPAEAAAAHAFAPLPATPAAPEAAQRQPSKPP